MTANGQHAARKVLVGVTGSIAAYKAAELVSRLSADGKDVRVVMTQAATHFVGPVTFRSLTGSPVYVNMFDSGESSDIRHIELARFPEVVVVAPASAQTIGRLALGLADDLLACVVLATQAPVVVAPAMNSVMWSHPAVQANIETLRSFGYTIVDPGEGRLACGETGPGRLAPLEAILEEIERKLG